MITIYIDTKCNRCGRCEIDIPEIINKNAFIYKLEINIELETISSNIKSKLEDIIQNCPAQAIRYVGDIERCVIMESDGYNVSFETRIELFCPFCNKRIEQQAKECKYCKNTFDWTDYKNRHALVLREIKKLLPGETKGSLKSSAEIALLKVQNMPACTGNNEYITSHENENIQNIVQCCICGSSNSEIFEKYKVLQRDNELGKEEYVCLECKHKLPKIFPPGHESTHSNGAGMGAKGTYIGGEGLTGIISGAIIGKMAQPLFDAMDKAIDSINKIRVIPYYEIKYSNSNQVLNSYPNKVKKAKESASAYKSKPTVITTFTLIGGFIGFVCGLPVGGIGCIPGAMTGASIGWVIDNICVAIMHRDKCFIATAAYGSSSGNLCILRNYRDYYLLKRFWGKIFVFLYYLIGPFLALFVKKSRVCKRITLIFLDYIIVKIKSHIKRGVY